MDDASRIIWLKDARDCPSNDNTLFMPAPATLSADETAARLRQFYDPIRNWVQERRRGIAIVVLDDDGIQAKAYVRAYERRINTAILGRHDKADVLLGEDPTVSLRHLAVLVSPLGGGKPPHLRIVDLRTTTVFTDVSGTRLRACESDLPFVVRCGRYVVLFAPVADTPLKWPEEPDRSWEALASRDASSLELPAPATLDDGLLAEDEAALGELEIASEHGNRILPVGRRAVRAGVLLGRSDRCDGDDLLKDHHISRVHLLIVEIAGRLYAIDTASKNGVWSRSSRARAKPLDSGASISLCGRATVTWRFFH